MNAKDSNGQTNNAETFHPLLSSPEHEVSENMDEENKDWRQTHEILRQVINPDNKTIYINRIINCQVLESYPPELWVKMSLKRVEELRGTRTLEPGQENAATQEKAAYSENAVIDEGSEVNNDCF